jgi:ATP/maltotriose-dependent transcriptional regulator MalT
MKEQEDQGVPAGRSHIIERPRLTRLLDGAKAPVIMLIAPAGYGKTTLARQWLATREHVWYQGSTASPDVAALALGIAEAVSAMLPGAGRRLREWLPTSREPEDEVDVIADFLEADFAGWVDDTWFVIDDYHLLSSRASEELVLKLFIEKDRKVILTSRRRPEWSSAREVLYGNFFELGQSSLAMTVDEANDVLSSTDNEAVEGLVALANGWPAVIGLAAMTTTQMDVQDGLPDTLYDYLAEELFGSLAPPTREALCRLALVPTINRETAQALLGPSSEQVLQVAESAGMLVVHGSRDRRFHPLLQAFLGKKLLELPATEIRDAVGSTTRVLIAARGWNDAFLVINRFRRSDLLDELLSGALPPLTAQGGLATIRGWLEFGREHRFNSPYLDLADAELAFREGKYDRSASLAKLAAATLPPSDPLRSMAYYRAGQSRSLMDDCHGALDHFQSAYTSATTIVDSRNALWGQFSAAFELEQTLASNLLNKFMSVGPPDQSTLVRSAHGALMLAVRDGGLAEALPQAVPTTEMVDHAHDPLIRSSFWYGYATAQTLFGQFALALRGAQRGLEETKDFRLKFAAPHFLAISAAASIGLRDFAAAEAAISHVEKWADEMGDIFLSGKTRALKCRLYISQRLAEEALEIAAHPVPEGLSLGLHAELGAMRAAAYALNGDARRAAAMVTESQVSTWMEPQSLLMWIAAVCSLMLGSSDAQAEVQEAFAQTNVLGAFNSFVFAYRLHPETLQKLGGNQKFIRTLQSVLTRANDQKIAHLCGIRVSPQPSRNTAGELTDREREVYALLAQGKSNREIAGTLFIAEGTAKVHVRHVLQKLGVRTRTQAALKAAREN